MSDLRSAADLVDVRHISKQFVTGRQGFLASTKRAITAVRDVSFTIREGETLGLIGESGSGKTTVGRCIALLETPGSGKVIAFGEDLSKLDRKAYLGIRKKIQMVFQDSRTSMDPRWTVRHTLEEPLKYLRDLNRGDRYEACKAAMEEVGLRPELLERYRHQLSGGQAQRVNIARALAAEPRLIVLDEPIASIDAALRRQLSVLLRKLQEQRKLGYLLISHDIRHIQEICDRVAVMHNGEIVELDSASKIFSKPRHQYSQWFISASRGDTVPMPDQGPAEDSVAGRAENLA